MPRFSYIGIDKSGATARGHITAQSDIDALDQLERQGLSIASLDQGGDAVPWWQKEIALFGDAKALKPKEQAQFFKTVHTMIASGFTVTRALDFAASQATRAKPKRMFQSISDNVSAGDTLASALEETQGFQSRLVGLVRLGECANQLESVLGNVSEIMTADIRRGQQIRQALVYPTILLAMSILVLLMLVFFLAPTLMPVFRSAGVTPPGLLSGMDRIGTIWVRHWPLILLSAGLLFLAGSVFRKRLGHYLSSVFWVLPGFGAFLRSRETLRLVQTLQLMMGSGASLPAALGTAASIATKRQWQTGLEDVRQKVEGGQALSTAIAASELADPATLAFIEAGEESDQMADMLGQAAHLMEERTRNQMDQVLRLLTPILTLFIGGAIGFLIFTTIGAILDLNELAT